MVLREAQRIGLTDRQRDLFERDGYLVVENALDADLVSRLTDAVDRVWTAHRDPPPVAGADPLHLLAFVGRDPAFIELLDHEPILRLVVDLLGRNIFMYHCHLDVHPPMRGRPRARGCGTRTAASRTTTWRPTRARGCR